MLPHSTDAPLRVFVQARMSSRRFPGKVLAPFRGRPMIVSVVESVREALPEVPLTVLTSVDPTDDPLAVYLSSLGVDVFRGPLHDVFARFRACLEARPASWVMRLCADSPLASATVLRAAAAARADDVDLITTTRPRTLPRGQNIEAVRTQALLEVDLAALDADEREHVTRHFYRDARRFRIVNLAHATDLSGYSLAVDEVDDLERIERLLAEQPALTAYGTLKARLDEEP